MTKCLTCGADVREGCGDPACPYDQTLDAEAEHFAKITSREVVARWMIDNGFATGHGDSLYDLLRELERQVNELKAVVYAARPPIRRTHAVGCGYWVDENCTCRP